MGIHTGKNLYKNFDTQTKNGVTVTFTNGKYIINGTPTATTYFVQTQSDWTSLPAGTYTLSWGNNFASSIQGSVAIYGGSGDVIRWVASIQPRSSTFTLNSATEKIRVQFGFSKDQTFTNSTMWLQLESGTTATTYTPYYLPDIYSATGTGEVKRLYSVYRKSANLFKSIDSYAKSAQTNNGSVTDTAENGATIHIYGSWSRYAFTVTGLKPSTEYVYSAYLVKEDDSYSSGLYIDGNYQSTAFSKTSKRVYMTFTTGADETSKVLMLYGNWSGTSKSADIVYNDIQIEQGSTATTYHPYLEKIHSILPTGFQAVEYITSDGHSYFNTDVYGTNNSKIAIDLGNTGNNFLYSGRTGYSDTNQIGLWVQDTSTGYFAGTFRWGDRTGTVYTSNIYATDRKLVTTTDTKITVNDWSMDITASSAFTGTATIWLLSGNDGANPIIATLYSAKFYDGSTLVRDFIPCYTTATCTSYDGTSMAVDSIGLYDKVSGKFFRNMGSGTFTKGADL